MPPHQGRRGGHKQTISSGSTISSCKARLAAPRQSNELGLLGGADGNVGIDDFLSSEPFTLEQDTITEVKRSLRAAEVPETQWLQELQCMAQDGSLQAFLLTIDRSLALKLRCREEEILAELVLVQQKLCALHTSTHPSLLSSGQC